MPGFSPAPSAAEQSRRSVDSARYDLRLALGMVTFYLGANLLTGPMHETARVSTLLTRTQEVARLVDAPAGEPGQ